MPLVAAQPGIWMADQISPHCNAYAVAHYVELNGSIDSARLLQAIVLGLHEVDTLQLRFEERDGVPIQWLDERLAVSEAEFVDLASSPDADAVARGLMDIDFSDELRAANSKLLYRHVLMRLADKRWFWYQRYHHMLVDGFRFTAIARRIVAIYTHLCRDQPLEPSSFTPFSEVVAEYQAYQQAPAWQWDADFGSTKRANCRQRRRLPTPRIHRLKQHCDN